MFHELTSDQQELALAMSEISEKSYSAGWLSGLEFALWHLLESGKSHYDRYALSTEELGNLRRLSARCEGWIMYEDGDGEVFVPLAQWKAKFSEEAPQYLKL